MSWYAYLLENRFFVSFFFTLPSLKFYTVATAMLEFCLGKEKISFSKIPNFQME